MGIVKKISMIGLAGVTALALTMPSAEARNGRKGALIGGLLVGAIAGAAIAGAAQGANDDDYQPYPRQYAPQPVYGDDQDAYYQPAPVYQAQPSYYYRPAPVYRVQPRYAYDGCGPGPQLDPDATGRERDLYWHQRHKWKKACRSYGGY